jgi:hypothetical protein
LRFSFALFEDFECYEDFSPIVTSTGRSATIPIGLNSDHLNL